MRKGAGRTNRIAVCLAVWAGLTIWGTGTPSGQAASDPAAWGKDPFGAPPGSMDEGGGGEREPVTLTELQGVIAGPAGMVAIVDQKIVRIGDRIGAELVEEITPRAVVLRRGSHVRRLVISVLPTHER